MSSAAMGRLLTDVFRLNISRTTLSLPAFPVANAVDELVLVRSLTSFAPVQLMASEKAKTLIL